MGREVKRVPLGFRWPMNQIWRGYLSPYSAQKCRACDGRGLNEASRRIEDSFYRHSCPPGEMPWFDRITEDEAAALIAHGRCRRWVPGVGWSSENPPGADEINASQGRGNPLGEFGHDAINRWILCETRAKRLGVYGKCEYCGGEGEFWTSPAMKRKAKAWRSFGPPKGEGWQMWETTSEGSPISPIFATPEELAKWLAETQASTFGAATATYDEWLRMIMAGWAPSMIGVPGEGVVSGVRAIGRVS